MDLNTELQFALSLHATPSEKIGLITLLYANKPLTTSELNAINQCTKTFDNYKALFAEFIESGLVDLQPMKDSKGTVRNHFILNYKVLESLIENM